MRSITTLAITILQGAALSAQESAVLRLAPPAGQVSHYRYEMRMWMQVPGMPVGDSSAPSISMTGGFTQSVTHVDGDAHESRTAYDSLKLDAPMMGSMGGQPEHMLKGLVIVTRIDGRGRVLSTQVTGGDSTMQRQLSQVTSKLQLPLMPEAAVTAGTTWVDSQNVSLPMGAVGQMHSAARVTYRLERIEHQGGSILAVISGTGNTTQASTMMTASGTVTSEFVLDLSAGRLVKSTAVMNMTMSMSQMGQSIPMRSVATTVLVP